MSRRLWLLNFALVALVGVLFWRLRLKYLAEESEQRAFLSQAPHMRALLAPPASPPLGPVKPADYAEVAEKMLFSKDRNPNVIVQPPPPPPPPPPMPALPFYYGQMAIGQPVVLLGVANNGEQKSYHVGEDVGKFKLTAFDVETITFEWDGKQVVRKLQELIPKEVVPAAAPATAASGPNPDAGPKTSIVAPAVKQELATKPAEPGVDMGAGFRGCVAGDTSPAGTVSNGYKKNITQGLMGQTCYWEKVK
ncbi:MAG: hypothetical protein JO307_21580 [Bryobacterales bacterium]|nr:hypothetical protein [Bryobacterales bacterium]